MNYGMQNLGLIDGESNDWKLEMYSLGMQGWFGDNTRPRPTEIFEFVEKAKWDAYTGKKGMSRVEAQEQFNDFCEYWGF